MSNLPFWPRLLGYIQRRTTTSVWRRPFVLNQRCPIISFTFDDFPRSALTVGGKILVRHGATGTYYVSLGLAGKQTASGQIFFPEDLNTLVEEGHELGCHTFSHCDSWATATRTFENSIIQNHAALARLFPYAEFKTFSYPISLPRPHTKARIADYFLGCRGGGQTFNKGKIDLNQLSAYFLEKSRGNLQVVKDLIDRNREACGWLIFATHDLACAASLIVCGFELISLNRNDPRKIKFIFRSEEKIHETVKKFWDGNLKVDAQSYFNAVKRIKNQIYSE